jgi:hypothetical protein
VTGVDRAEPGVILEAPGSVTDLEVTTTYIAYPEDRPLDIEGGRIPRELAPHRSLVSGVSGG